MFTPQNLDEIRSLLCKENKVVIVTHYNPDGDAIGSSLGLKHILRNYGVEADVVVPNDFPKFLKWMPEAKKITIADYKRKKAREILQSADVLFILDFNSPQRSGDLMAPWITNSNSIKILIDHHQMPDAFDYVYSDTTQPATCQMIYNFADALGAKEHIDLQAAQCLYCGIMTDTGGFRFRSTSAQTHRVVADLIEKGAEPSMIASSTWDTNTLSRFKLLGLILGRMELVADGQVAILTLTRDELRTYGFEKGDTEGFVNYGLSIQGVKMAAFFMEDLYEDFIKISFRSKDDLDVNQFSRKHFNGGGHINAAGGKYYKTLESTVADFQRIIEDEPSLQASDSD